MAELAESHTAVVVFCGDRAYKVKKPVDFGFLDFRSVRERERACRREVELNRRLAPDVYLDLLRISGEDGRTCDWMVVMRRMPAGSSLSSLVAAGAEVRPGLTRLARALASFHSSADTGPRISAAGGKDALRRRWVDNLDGARRFAGDVLDAEQLELIERLALRYVDGRAELFADRARRGAVVDGHGDLQADDVYLLDDGPRILDCLEFDDELRHVDGLDDAAFLAMDLERLGAAGLGEFFLARYGEYAGGAFPDSLARHYVAYRAFVRAKVACLRHEQGVADQAELAARLAGIAQRHLLAARPRLVLVGGPPGTGKSTLARGLGDRLGASLLRTDEIRAELAGEPADGYGTGRYEPSQVHETYRRMAHRAKLLLQRGELVLLDASWSSAREREHAREVARETFADIVEIRCAAPADLARQRIDARRDDPSEATGAVADEMRSRFADWPEAVEVDTSGAAGGAVAAARRYVESPPAQPAPVTD
ncbi:AAA family ATPase [Saccharopolyspora sp. SCSIO 74807]|uniref:bifunctional aminoglycoside phosphotransferase/ATP-binding protein n=1 Tax=Saccharopolyspora sp. SCSIO 74807 TaxID=3118084 RepID=UPI0030D041A0